MRFRGPGSKFQVARSAPISKGSEYLFKGNKDVKIFESALTGVPIAKNNLRIKFASDGFTNRPYYRIVLAHKLHNHHVEVEQLGTYDPFPNVHNEKICSLNFERIKYHIAHGAYPVRPVRRLLGLSGFLPLDPSLMFFAENLRRLRVIEGKVAEKKLNEQAED